MLLLVLMYVGALFCVTMLGKEPELQDAFGNVFLGLWTHFVITTQEAWPDYSDMVMQVAGQSWSLYFVLFLCISALAVMNLVTGVVCEKLMLNASPPDEIGKADRPPDAAEEAEKAAQFCEDLCACLNKTVSRDDFAEILTKA